MRDSTGIINAIYYAVQFAGSVMQFFILLRVVFSWMQIKPSNSIIRLIYNITELILSPIRNLVNKMGGTSQAVRLDLSPLIAILFLQVFNGLLIRLAQVIVVNIYG